MRVKRPGLRVVRARNGYYEPRGRRPADPKPGRPIRRSPAARWPARLPVAGLPLKVFAGAYKGEAPNAAVAVVLELDASKLDFVEANGTFNEALEIASAATDSKGKVFPGERHTANLTLKPDTYARAKERGFRVVTQVNLPPGRYQLRLAAGNKNGKAGSVLYDLEVPEFYKEPFVDERRGAHGGVGRPDADGEGQGSARRLPARPADRHARVRGRRHADVLRRVLRERREHRRTWSI